MRSHDSGLSGFLWGLVVWLAVSSVVLAVIVLAAGLVVALFLLMRGMARSLGAWMRIPEKRVAAGAVPALANLVFVQMAPDVFRVCYREGTAQAGQEYRYGDFMLLRAAEMALAMGWKYFSVLKRIESPTDVLAVTATVFQSPAVSTLGPAEIYSVPARPKPGMVFKCFNRPGDAIVWDAAETCARLRRAHNLDERGRLRIRVRLAPPSAFGGTMGACPRA
jgi:hypothetical protein